ncbi:1685_t:CDS:2, partial [Dentiscutata heterogama]
TTKPWLWGSGVGGNSWRTTRDINAPWPSIVSIIDSQISLTKYGGPGGWNDPDMLVLGFDEITYDEQVTHYVFWSAMKAPLILGCNVYSKTDNKTSYDIWTGPLNDGYVAITAVNIPKHGVEFIKLIGGNIIDNNRPCLNY